MTQEEKISRKQFLKLLSWIFLAPFAFMSYLAIKDKRKEALSITRIKVSSISKGFYSYNGIIVSNFNELKFFSARCTHLGCRITDVKGEIAVCPCHGSEYACDGRAIKGPASENLKVLKYTKENNEIVVYDA